MKTLILILIMTGCADLEQRVEDISTQNLTDEELKVKVTKNRDFSGCKAIKNENINMPANWVKEKDNEMYKSAKYVANRSKGNVYLITDSDVHGLQGSIYDCPASSYESIKDIYRASENN